MKKSITISWISTVILTAFTASAQQGASYSNRPVSVYTTAQNTNLRLSSAGGTKSFSTSQQPLETQICVFIDPSKTYQTLLGIGGAATDASAEVFAKLSPAHQQEFLNAYYDKEKGIGYSLLRTNMASCDFSSGSYGYIKEGDKELKSFNIDHDRKFRLPFIKKAIATAGGKLTTFVSPWSPPAFMKDNKNLLFGGKLLPEFRQSWANFFVAYIRELEKEKIPVWGLTVQNEPMARQIWESCIYTAEEERDFVKDFLGPTIRREMPDKKIVFWDHNRDLMPNRASTMMNDQEAARYIWGMGFHWYETWAGGEPMFDNLTRVHEDYPNLNLMFTEGCVEKFDNTKYQFWPNGERYGKEMIHGFNAGTVAWTDWNILLDDKGGPNHVGNFCFAPVHADANLDLVYTPSYYYIGHFSKFIRPGAKRISTAVSRSQLLSTTFCNEDGKMVTVVMNQSDAPVNYKLIIGKEECAFDIPAHAIQTLVF